MIFYVFDRSDEVGPLHAAYSAAKHAVEGFIEAFRVDLMHYRLPISVTSIRPATMNIPLFWIMRLLAWGIACSKASSRNRPPPPTACLNRFPAMAASTVSSQMSH